jgi:hypothetical protein
MLWLSENDLKLFFGDVIRNVAKELKLKDWEWHFHSELLEQIRSKNSVVSDLLDKFFAAYKDWHDFHVKIEHQNKAGKLSAEENAELLTCITSRDNARKSLLQELRK